MKKKFMYICLMTSLFSSGVLVNNLNGDDTNDTKKKSSQSLNNKISKVSVAARQLVERLFTSRKKKAMAKQCIKKISKYYKITDDEKSFVFLTFNAINDLQKAERILQNIIKIYQSDGYKKGGLFNYDKLSIFDIIFGKDSAGYSTYTEYCTHDRLEILEFMTEKSVPEAIKITTSSDYLSDNTHPYKLLIIPYILGSANETDLNFRKNVVQEYMKLITSENNRTSIKHDVEMSIVKSLFKTTNEQELNKAIKEIKAKYNLK